MNNKLICSLFCLLFIIFENLFALNVRSHSIFGKRMNRIDNNIRQAIEDGQIVPDLVDAIPLHKVQVLFKSNYSDFQIQTYYQRFDIRVVLTSI